MRISFLKLIVATALPLALVGCASGVKHPVASQGAFATGQYRNLFVEAGHPASEVREKIDAAYQQLFHGDAQNQTVFYLSGTNANGPFGYVFDVNSGDVRSEGLSYGMMIAVQLDKKTDFDAMWNWSKTFMYQSASNHPSYGYFSWSVKTNGVPNDEMPAPDGEEYYAMALYFAAGRWGNGQGIYNYKAEADQLLTDMRHRAVITGNTVTGPKTAGALFEPNLKMVRFTSDVENWNHTDPSYQLPAFYELWARYGPKQDRAFWSDAAQTSRDFLQRAAHPVTGLGSDYANFDGTPWTAPWNEHSGDYQYDSWRTAMNWSVDWAWWKKDPRQQELSDRIQAFFESQGLKTYGSRFKVDGTQYDASRATAHMAMNATASLAATNPRAKLFVEELWNAPVPSGHYRYYDGMLYLLGMLHCGGEFRIWSPK